MNLDFGNNQDSGDKVIGKLFPKLAANVKRTPNRANRRAIHNFNPGNYLNFVNSTINHNIKNAANIFRKDISSLKKKHLKLLALELNLVVNDTIPWFKKQWYLMIQDLIDTQLYIPIPPKIKKVVPKYHLKMLFSNKAFDFINLPKIIRCPDVSNLIPEGFPDKDIPMVVFTLTKPI